MNNQKLLPAEAKVKLGFQSALFAYQNINQEEDEYKRFGFIKDIIFNSTEFTPKTFIKQIAEKISPNDTKTQLNLLKVTRHLLAHFPFFQITKEVFIDFDMMLEKNEKGDIYSLFTNPPEIGYYEFIYEDTKEIIKWSINIPKLKRGERVLYSDLFEFSPPINQSDAGMIMIAQISFTIFQEYIRSIDGMADKLGITRI